MNPLYIFLFMDTFVVLVSRIKKLDPIHLRCCQYQMNWSHMWLTRISSVESLLGVYFGLPDVSLVQCLLSSNQGSIFYKQIECNLAFIVWKTKLFSEYHILPMIITFCSINNRRIVDLTIITLYLEEMTPHYKEPLKIKRTPFYSKEL